MEDILEKLIKKPNKQSVKDSLTLLCHILENIINHPQDEKYRSISAHSEKMTRMLTDHDECAELLLAMGFRKRVVEFHEKWVLAHLSAIDKARLQDTLVTLQEYRDSIYVPTDSTKTRYEVMKESKEKHKSHIEEILHQAELDREEVRQRHERFMMGVRSKSSGKSGKRMVE